MVALIDAIATSQDYKENINVTLKRLQYSHLNKIIFPCLSSNSIRNKFGDLNKMVDENIDILCIANLFPIISLYISIIRPYVLNRWLDSIC